MGTLGVGLLSSVTFFCPGKPIQQGSKNIGRHGQMYDAKSEDLRIWRAEVGLTGLASMNKIRLDPFPGEVELWLDFRFLRPKAHYNTKGELRSGAPSSHIFKPDLDKLVRAVLDGLTGVVYDDDRYVTNLSATKTWTSIPEMQGVQVIAVDLTAGFEEPEDGDSPDGSGL